MVSDPQQKQAATAAWKESFETDMEISRAVRQSISLGCQPPIAPAATRFTDGEAVDARSEIASRRATIRRATLAGPRGSDAAFTPALVTEQNGAAKPGKPERTRRLRKAPPPDLDSLGEESSLQDVKNAMQELDKYFRMEKDRLQYVYHLKREDLVSAIATAEAKAITSRGTTLLTKGTTIGRGFRA